MDRMKISELLEDERINTAGLSDAIYAEVHGALEDVRATVKPTDSDSLVASYIFYCLRDRLSWIIGFKTNDKPCTMVGGMYNPMRNKVVLTFGLDGLKHSIMSGTDDVAGAIAETLVHELVHARQLFHDTEAFVKDARDNSTISASEYYGLNSELEAFAHEAASSLVKRFGRGARGFSGFDQLKLYQSHTAASAVRHYWKYRKDDPTLWERFAKKVDAEVDKVLQKD